MQTTGVSMEVVEKEIKATEKVLKKYREDGYSGAVATAREIAEGLQIERSFAESRTRRRRRLFEYEAEEEGSEMSPEEKFKANFFFATNGSCSIFKRTLRANAHCGCNF